MQINLYINEKTQIKEICVFNSKSILKGQKNKILVGAVSDIVSLSIIPAIFDGIPAFDIIQLIANVLISVTTSTTLATIIVEKIRSKNKSAKCKIRKKNDSSEVDIEIEFDNVTSQTVDEIKKIAELAIQEYVLNLSISKEDNEI